MSEVNDPSTLPWRCDARRSLSLVIGSGLFVHLVFHLGFHHDAALPAEHALYRQAELLGYLNVDLLDALNLIYQLVGDSCVVLIVFVNALLPC